MHRKVVQMNRKVVQMIFDEKRGTGADEKICTTICTTICTGKK